MIVSKAMASHFKQMKATKEVEVASTTLE